MTSDFIGRGRGRTTQGLHSPKEVLKARRHPATDAAHGRAGQPLVGQRLRDRRRRAAGPRARHDHRHAAPSARAWCRTSSTLPGGAILKLTIAVYLTPDGHRHQQDGHPPRHQGERQPQDQEGRALQRALSFIATASAGPLHADQRLTPVAPLPGRVARWGKFWALEPLFADERSCLVAQRRTPPRSTTSCWPCPRKRNRLRIVEVLGTATTCRAVLQGAAVRRRRAAGVRRGDA